MSHPVLEFMSNIDDILSGKSVTRCPYCHTENIEIDTKMEKYNEDLGRTYYKCKRCKKKFWL